VSGCQFNVRILNIESIQVDCGILQGLLCTV
jgi:hypothetical protein